MFTFFDFALFAVSLFAIAKGSLVGLKRQNLVFSGYALGALFLALVTVLPATADILSEAGYSIDAELLSGWFRICAISLTLCSLAVLIRNSKPQFARFPMFFCAVPLVLIATYPYASHTLVLKEWLIGAYQGGAIFILLMVHLVLLRTSRSHALILGGAGVLVLAYLFFWFPVILPVETPWLWKLLLASGIVVVTIGYDRIPEVGLSRNIPGQASA